MSNASTTASTSGAVETASIPARGRHATRASAPANRAVASLLVVALLAGHHLGVGAATATANRADHAVVVHPTPTPTPLSTTLAFAAPAHTTPRQIGPAPDPQALLDALERCYGPTVLLLWSLPPPCSRSTPSHVP